MKRNPFSIQHLRIFRFMVQSLFGLFTLYIGYRFYLFFVWAVKDLDYAARPAAVEGFLPISALMATKRLLLTGNFDIIHPAGLTIFLAAIFISLLFRKSFCGWICPVGYASNLAERLGKFCNVMQKPARWFDYLLSSIKYLLLLFFVGMVFMKMDLVSIEFFLRSPYNIAADAKMLLFFLNPSPLAASLLITLSISSFFLPNTWCRYFCPYGALLGLTAALGPVHVKRNEENCIMCKECEKICPAALCLTQKRTIRDPDCIGCMECIGACPQKNCLENSVLGKKIHPLLIPIGAVGLFLLLWLLARLSGHWESTISPVLFKKAYQLAAKAFIL